MLENPLPSLKRGVNKLFKHQQLWYTIFIAILIVASFTFVINQFRTIAKDAQDRLINERLGAMQDSLVEFAPDYFGTDSDLLQEKIKRIAFQNNTILDFKVVEFKENRPFIVASLDSDEIGKIDEVHEDLYDIASINAEQSTTLPGVDDGDRVYTTIRPILDVYGNEIGAIITKQSLSEADVKISNSIQTSIFIFIIIVILIMFLFFRHAKIVDYISLYKKLEEIDALKDDFISMASHELRTPLTIIRGYAEDLSEIKRMPKAAQEDINRIDIAARQLDNLVNDMLDVSRIEQERMKIETVPVASTDIKNMIKDVVDGLLPNAEEKGLKIITKHTLSETVNINVDKDKFRQVITNIIGNAVKYTKKGKVTVQVSEPGPKMVEFRVIDTGVGMSAEETQNLFKKFYRIKNEDTANVRGTGLGLWITKQIVELMGGTISVESIKGVGTHFIVRFKKV
jgi:signal transduction histidine kinase